ncbi:MAG: 50S ribosomal protein L18 [Syntrophomonadaceae bacterium]|nr:50S ribosomal protein L18 [Syntrophomonadaceae bacterium]
MIKKPSRNGLRMSKHKRMRRNMQGTPDKPRLCVFRSLNHIYAQVIDDVNKNTLVSASTLEAELKDTLKEANRMDAAKAVGTAVATKALAQGISEVVFDRNGYKYHGKVAALAGAAREAGLKF